VSVILNTQCNVFKELIKHMLQSRQPLRSVLWHSHVTKVE